MKLNSCKYYLLQLLLLCLLLPSAICILWTTAAQAENNDATVPQDQLRHLQNRNSPTYRTPRAGEGFTTELFGRTIAAQPENRRSVNAIDFGVQANLPGADNRAVLPFGAVYLWRHPDDKSLFRADLVGVYNDIFWARSIPKMGPFEWVLTFNNYTLPMSQYELIDGKAVKSERLIWGYVRPGFGLGYRQKISPGHQDNMLAIDLTIEPGFLIFGKDSKAASNFVVPNSTFELREHLQVRLDALERNLLSLPHSGFAAGADLIHANRTNWKTWGLNSSETGGREYLSANGYLLGATAVPGIAGDRHRLIGSIHAGIGSHLDRFSAPRIGGGVLTMGEEYGSTWRPVLPGTIIQEYFPKHYAIAIGEYRWEALPFTFFSVNTSIGWLDRLRQTGPALTDTTSKNAIFSSVGGRLTTVFLYKSRMQLSYNYNFSEVRNGKYGGHEILMHISHSF